MNQNQRQFHQPSGSTRSRQPTLLATATGHPNHSNARVHQIHSVDPLHILKNSSEAHAQPYLYSSHPYPIHVLLHSPNLSGSTSTPSHTTTTPPPILSVRTSSIRHSSPSTRPSSTQLSSIPIPRDNTRSIPRKRARKYVPSPPTLYPGSPISSSSGLSLEHPPHLPLPSPIDGSLERPFKRPRPDTGRPSTVTYHEGLEPRAISHQLPPSKPMPKKEPLHPLAVDYSRPLKPMVPQPSLRLLSLQKSSVPPPSFPENLDSKCSLDDQLRGPVDPVVHKELGELMRKQQNRVQSELGGSTDPFLAPTPISSLDTGSSSPRRGVDPPRSRQEVVALYGPPPRNNGSAHLGQSHVNPNMVVLDDNDDDDGFEGVLDLYYGAVQGSTLSMELEFAVGSDVGLIGVGWKDVSALEVSIKCRSSTPSPSEGLQESRIRTLTEYKQVVEAEKSLPPSRSATLKEDPPLGIEWSYSCCGYTTGRVVNVRSANVTPNIDTYVNSRKKRR